MGDLVTILIAAAREADHDDIVLRPLRGQPHRLDNRVGCLQGRQDAAWRILIVMAGAEALDGILKIQFHRQRPEPFFGLLAPPSYSFPSGHALLSCCLYGALATVAGTRRRLTRCAAAVLILAIGASRVYLGVHYPSDVIAGYLVAIVWMAGVTAVYTRIATIEK